MSFSTGVIRGPWGCFNLCDPCAGNSGGGGGIGGGGGGTPGNNSGAAAIIFGTQLDYLGPTITLEFDFSTQGGPDAGFGWTYTAGGYAESGGSNTGFRVCDLRLRNNGWILSQYGWLFPFNGTNITISQSFSISLPYAYTPLAFPTIVYFT